MVSTFRIFAMGSKDEPLLSEHPDWGDTNPTTGLPIAEMRICLPISQLRRPPTEIRFRVVALASSETLWSSGNSGGTHRIA